MKAYLQMLSNGNSLSREEMRRAVTEMFVPETSDSEIASFLTALKIKGESVEEMASLVEVLREKALPMSSRLTNVMDNCGTGGDGSQSFNISTTSAFVLAGAGVKMAKHGNRSVSSKTGSADVLEKLGVGLDFGQQEVEELIEDNGIAFLFAPHIHAGMKKVMKVRRDLKIPTIFNLIGPLTNPVKLETQLVGVYRRDMLEKMANVLHELGTKRAIVLNGAGYMDEASLAGENHLVLLDEGDITAFTLTGEEVGLPHYENSEIRGGGAEENAKILLEVLKGKNGPHLDTVLFNTGIALFANGKVTTIAEGVKLARETIESGEAYKRLEQLVLYSKNKQKQVI